MWVVITRSVLVVWVGLVVNLNNIREIKLSKDDNNGYERLQRLCTPHMYVLHFGTFSSHSCPDNDVN